MASRGAFPRVFGEAVAHAGRDGRLKKQMAAECGLRADHFSHLLSGRRPPTTRRLVLQIARGLRLDEAWTSRLLAAAGFEEVSWPHAEGSAALVRALGEPERTIVQGEIERDIELNRSAWDHYVNVQSQIQARQWVDASNLYQEGLDQYWQLRASAERYLAQVYLSAATSRSYTNRLREAQELCSLGLEAARAAGSQMFEVMLLARLADIHRLQSDFGAASKTYEAGLAVLAEWEHKGQAEERTHRDREERHDWRVHWRHRIGRKRGTTLIQMGRSDEAQRELRPVVEYFRRMGHADELSRALFGLGWAKAQIGDIDAAHSLYREGMEHAQAQSQALGYQDVVASLRGHLYLGMIYIDQGELDRADAELQQAAALADRPPLREFQEAGRVYFQLGRLHLNRRQWAEALKYLVKALEFSTSREDRILLSQAHNVMGWYHWQSGGPAHAQRAMHEFGEALAAARASRPASSYYECAALVNVCTVRLRGSLGVIWRPPGRPPGAETEWEVDDLVQAAKEIGREWGYFGHLARLALLEAEWALGQGHLERASSAADDAHSCARNYNRYLQRTVDLKLAELGLARG